MGLVKNSDEKIEKTIDKRKPRCYNIEAVRRKGNKPITEDSAPKKSKEILKKGLTNRKRCVTIHRLSKKQRR